jgi:subtilisin family serine protease
MFCLNCGTQNDDGNRNCINCGSPLPKIQSPNKRGAGLNSTRNKTFVIKLLLLFGGIILIAVTAIFIGPKIINRTSDQPILTIQNIQRKCVYTTTFNQGETENNASQSDPEQNIPGDSAPSIQSVTEDTGGCLRFVGDTIHFTLNSGETGGIATVDIGDLHTNIQLYDNGTNGDKSANDGIYEYSYITTPSDAVRGVRITGHFTSKDGKEARAVYAPTVITITDWSTGSASVNPDVNYIPDPVTGKLIDPNRVIISFTDNTSPEKTFEVLNQHALRLSSWIPEIKVVEVALASNQKYEEISKALLESSFVEHVELNVAMESLGLPLPIPDEQLPLDQANYLNVIRAKLGWKITKGASSIDTTIIDSGVNWKHPDLKNQIISYVLPGLTDPEDLFGHGTRIAGIIAAEQGNGGISGIAPGVKLRIYKAGEYVGPDFNPLFLMEYIYQAASAKTRVISISQCTDLSVWALTKAIEYAHKANVVLVAGIGEQAGSETHCGGREKFYKDWQTGANKVFPASLSEVLAVGATETDDTIASYSSAGDQVIYAPVPSNSGGIKSTDNIGSYSNMAGTSFAVPQVSALAALII